MASLIAVLIVVAFVVLGVRSFQNTTKGRKVINDRNYGGGDDDGIVEGGDDLVEVMSNTIVLDSAVLVPALPEVVETTTLPVVMLAEANIDKVSSTPKKRKYGKRKKPLVE